MRKVDCWFNWEEGKMKKTGAFVAVVAAFFCSFAVLSAEANREPSKIETALEAKLKTCTPEQRKRYDDARAASGNLNKDSASRIMVVSTDPEELRSMAIKATEAATSSFRKYKKELQDHVKTQKEFRKFLILSGRQNVELERIRIELKYYRNLAQMFAEAMATYDKKTAAEFEAALKDFGK